MGHLCMSGCSRNCKVTPSGWRKRPLCSPTLRNELRTHLGVKQFGLSKKQVQSPWGRDLPGMLTDTKNPKELGGQDEGQDVWRCD